MAEKGWRASGIRDYMQVLLGVCLQRADKEQDNSWRRVQGQWRACLFHWGFAFLMRANWLY